MRLKANALKIYNAPYTNDDMGFFDLFSRKKAEEPDIRREFDALKADLATTKQQVEAISSSLNVIYRNVSVIAHKNDTAILRREIAALQAKMKEMIVFARLSLQNHDELKEIKRHVYAGHTSGEPTKAVGQKETPALKSMKGMTSREREIISMLLDSEIPLSNIEIGTRIGISPVTVKGHINAIKKRYVGVVVDIARSKNKKDYSLNPEFRRNVLGV